MLEKLKLSGVRGFSQEAEAYIEFDKRLTLIWGHNGAGKTTIIETLKAATTGLFPPNSENGKSFFQDPRINSSNSTSACVKLNFRTSRGKPVGISRGYILSRRDKSRSELKKTENILKSINDKEEAEQKSLRVSDMDRIVPELLGLRPAILQYVTFCHQDESLWPFGDSTHLKNILDQIFATDAFAKTHDAQKKYLKKQSQVLSQKKEELKFKHEMVKQAKENRDKIKVMLEEETRLNSLIYETEQELIYLSQEKKKLQRLENLSTQLTNKHKEKAMMQKYLESLGSLDDLELLEDETKSVKYLEEQKRELENSKASLTQSISTLEEEKERSQHQLAQAQSEFSLLQEKFQEKLRLEEEVKQITGDSEPRTELQNYMKAMISGIEQFDFQLKTLKEKKNSKVTLKHNLTATLSSEEEALQSIETQITELGISQPENKKYLLAQDLAEWEQSYTQANLKITTQEELLNKKQSSISYLKEKLSSAKELMQVRQKELTTKACFDEAKQTVNKIIQENPEFSEMSVLETEQFLEATMQTCLYQLVFHENLSEETSNKVTQLTNGLESCQAELDKLHKYIEHSLGNFKQVTSNLELSDSQDLESVYEELKAKKNQLKSNLEAQVTASEVKASLLKESIETLTCSVCFGEVKSEIAMQQEIQTLENSKQKATERVSESIELCLQGMDLLKPLIKHQKDISALNTKLLSTKESLSLKTNELAQTQHLIVQKKSEKQRLEETIRKLNKVKSVVSENNLKCLSSVLNHQLAVRPEVDLTALEKKLSDAETTYSNITAELSELKTQKENCHSNITNIHKQIQALSNCVDIESLIQQKDQKLQRIQEKTQTLTTTELEITQLEQALTDLKSQKLNFKQNYRDKISNLSSLIENLENLSESTQKYSQAKLDLEKLNEVSSKLSEDLNSSRKQLTGHNKLLESVNQKLSLLSNTQFKLNQKQSILNYQNQLKEVNQEVLELQTKLDNYDSQALNKLTSTETSKKSQLDHSRGSLSALQKELNSLQQKHFTEHEQRAKELLVECEILERAINEQKLLLSYLDQAIVAFHTSKIDQINSILEELWKETYKGKDIHSVFIKTELNSTSKRANYSYRICFRGVKQELDMRGRCSAGQRMLASILIRIALAQAFTEGNIIIALDEPTTNMDSANSDGLAESIAALATSNPFLQLIIITHDRKFVETVYRSSPSGKYYHVKKVKGFSVINQQETKA